MTRPQQECNRIVVTGLKLYIFGAPRLEYQGQPVRVARRKALALADQPQSRDAVAALLWPDLAQDQARAALRSTLPALAAHSLAAWLAADRASLAVDRDALWVERCLNAISG